MRKSETIQYFHDQHARCTIAVDIDFNRYDLEDLLAKEDRSIKFDIGLACCHPNDNYDKAIGRNTAFDNMKEAVLYFSSVRVDSETNKLMYSFLSDDNAYYIGLRTSLNSEKPHLIEASAALVYEKRNR